MRQLSFYLGLVRIACLWTVLLAISAAHAQVGVVLSTDRPRYLRYEPIRTRVTLRNYSGNTLVFDSGSRKKQYLDFQIEDAQGIYAPRIDPKTNPIGKLVLGAGETRVLDVTLNNVYDLQKEGHYRIHVQVSHSRLRYDIRTEKPVDIEVRAGARIWSRTAGLPQGDTASGAIKSRTFTLLALQQKKNEVYCLRVEDDDYVYSVMRLGPRIASAKPQCDLDAVSNLHLLLQVRSRIFAYRVFGLDGKKKQSRYYTSDRDLPRLHRDPDIGRVMVVGGRLAEEEVDFELGPSHEERWRRGEKASARRPATRPPPSRMR